ncbi:MAG: prepilin-type N-terminal cleavage/methylation domain-containing protein [Magnetococcales bacterium]|nr:prepilin-type N-terminal cleavage/methylation domain-containing protein [Magnetococcales bacterium]
MTRSGHTGFSLLEVLVASVILFSAIAAATLVVRGAAISHDRARETIRLAETMTDLGDRIQLQLLDGNKKGEGYQNGLYYQWQATLLKEEVSYPRIDSDTLTEAHGLYTVSLHQVELTLSPPGLAPPRTFSYQELAWRK